MRDTLGDRMKQYEQQVTTSKFLMNAPVYARLDGCAFHTFTKGFRRPYCTSFQTAMQNTARYLVDKTGASLAYQQSDEISLVFLPSPTGNIPFFEGSQFKGTSVLASTATAKFMAECVSSTPELAARAIEKMPRFDCRMFAMPSIEETASMLYWRSKDAERNAISSACSVYYNHKTLLNVPTERRLSLIAQAGVDWSTVPDYFKFGTWVIKQFTQVDLPQETIDRIPVKHRPTDPVYRKVSRFVTTSKPVSVEQILQMIGGQSANS